MNAIRNYRNMYLINAYFYNSHDLRLMLKWAEKANDPWEYLIFLYKTDKSNKNFKTLKINIPENKNEFKIPEICITKTNTFPFPLKAIIAPTAGYGKENDLRVVDKYINDIGYKQIFW